MYTYSKAKLKALEKAVLKSGRRGLFGPVRLFRTDSFCVRIGDSEFLARLESLAQVALSLVRLGAPR